MERRIGLGAVFLFLVLLAASVASAQTPPPPSGYASASISADVVLEPLLAAAEADLGRGEPALALARATAVTGAVPPDSAMHVRAEGLMLLAQQRLGTTPPTTVAADVALAPLIDAAALDGPAGRPALARARIEFVLARVAGSSALATRASGLRAAIDMQAPVVTSPPVVATSPPITTQQYQPIYGGAAPTYVYTAPGSIPQVSPDARLQRGQTPEDPHRRGDAEIVELYITGGIYGAYVGAWIPWGSGLFDGSSGDDRARLTTVGVLIGGGIMTLGVFALDQIDRGLRTGVPAAISMGIRYGLGLGALSLGIYGARNSVDTPTAMNIVGFAGLGGALLAAGLSMGLEPHPSQVQFTQTAGLWGALFGAQLAMLVAPLLPLDPGPFGVGSGNTRQEVGFGLVAGGLSAGLVTGMLVSALHANPSARRSWHMTLGFLAGTGAGTLIWSLIGLLSEFDVPTLGGCQFVGALGGIILAGFLSGNDRDRTTWDDPEETVPTVQVSIAPTQGGGTIGLSGTF
jgi:hypothetical protein